MVNWLKKLSNSININLGQYSQEVQNAVENLVSRYSEHPQYPYSQEEGKQDIQRIIQTTTQNMQKLQTLLQQTISRIPWNGSVVTINVTRPPSDFLNKPDFLKPVTDAYISVGNPTSFNTTAEFTIFADEENAGKIEIDDILDAGDDDFFENKQTEQDYFNLVRELKRPGSVKSSKTFFLYTARPIQDRNLFMNATTVPPNIFLTNTYDRAEGIAMDLAGSSKIRDIWKIRIEEKYLMITLDTGREKDYQVIGNQQVPVKSIELIRQGE